MPSLDLLVGAEALLGVLVLVVLGLCVLTLRRRWLHGGAGTVDVSLRLRTGAPGRGWVLGVGRFAGDELQWYRVFSLSPRPRRTLSRLSLETGRRREPDGPERKALLAGTVVLECRTDAGPLELAMDPGAVTGLRAWIESRPPGTTLPS